MTTYINNLTFYDGKHLNRRGEPNGNPTKDQIKRGFVREAKVTRPAEVKDAPVRKQREPKRSTKRDSKLDGSAGSESGTDGKPS